MVLTFKKYFLTYSDSEVSKEHVSTFLATLDPTPVRWMIARETHQAGNHHIHVFVAFSDAFACVTMREFDTAGLHPNILGVRTEKGILRYISKEDVPLCHNMSLPSASHSALSAEELQMRNKIALEVPLKRQIDEGLISLNQLPMLKKARQIYDRERDAPVSLCAPCGFWIYGPTGVGKSRFVRDLYPAAYLKTATRFWDGYNYQSIVLMEDLDYSSVKDFAMVSNYLKIWADQYPFRVEYKGDPEGAVIRPEMLVVTSQSCLADLFGNDLELLAALDRRFRSHYFRLADRL